MSRGILTGLIGASLALTLMGCPRYQPDLSLPDYAPNTSDWDGEIRDNDGDGTFDSVVYKAALDVTLPSGAPGVYKVFVNGTLDGEVIKNGTVQVFHPSDDGYTGAMLGVFSIENGKLVFDADNISHVSLINLAKLPTDGYTTTMCRTP
jgi:hypothetical protein